MGHQTIYISPKLLRQKISAANIKICNTSMRLWLYKLNQDSTNCEVNQWFNVVSAPLYTWVLFYYKQVKKEHDKELSQNNPINKLKP